MSEAVELVSLQVPYLWPALLCTFLVRNLSRGSLDANLTGLPLVLELFLVAVVVVAAAFDLKSRRIPNWLTATGVLGGFTLQTGFRRTEGFRDAALGAILAFAIYFILFILRAMGAGDVKLMTAAGAIAGPSNWLIIFLASAVAGGILAVTFVLWHGTLLRTASNVVSVLRVLVRGKAPFAIDPRWDVAHPRAVTLPHAVPVAIGSLSFILFTLLHR